MRAWIRPSVLFFCSLALLLAALAPAQAQIHGVAPSVTSFGFGGNNNPTPGLPASVTSLGPNGYGDGGNCCYGPFFSGNPPRFSQHRAHDHYRFPGGVFMPVYVPYAVPYAQDDSGDDESVDVDYTYSRGVPKVYDRGPWYRDSAAPRPAPHHEPAPKAKADAAPPAPDDQDGPPEPVAPQPPTVLVFKDGHKSEVQNYAIVGDILFDFTDGLSRKILLTNLDLPATQKVNDDRGVDFQVPAKTAQASQKKQQP